MQYTSYILCDKSSYNNETIFAPITDIDLNIVYENNKKCYVIDILTYEHKIPYIAIYVDDSKYKYIKKLYNTHGLDAVIKYINKHNLMSQHKNFEIQYLKIDDIVYYNNYLELSSRRVIHEINSNIDPNEYNNIVSDSVELFESENNIELYLLGRSGRHVCIENNTKNLMRYIELRDKINIIIDDIVKHMSP